MRRRPTIPFAVSSYHRRATKTIFDTPGFSPRINLYITDTPRRLGHMCTSMAYLLSNEANEQDALDQFMTFVIGMLGLKRERLITEIEQAGVEINLIPYEEHPFFETEEGLELPENDRYWLATKLGQLLFIPFKNISADNYSAFFTNRTSALCSFTGVKPQEVGAAASLAIVMSLKGNVSRMGGVRRALMDCIRSEEFLSKQVLDRVLGYVIEILEWVEMAPYTFVLNALIRCASPILFWPDLQHEVNNFINAMDAVTRSDAPEFFRIYTPSPESSVVERGKFPNLFAVSMMIISRRQPSIKNVVKVANVDENFVKLLAGFHNEFVVDTADQISSRLVTYLPVNLSNAEVKMIQSRQVLALGDSGLTSAVNRRRTEQQAEEVGETEGAGQN